MGHSSSGADWRRYQSRRVASARGRPPLYWPDALPVGVGCRRIRSERYPSMPCPRQRRLFPALNRATAGAHQLIVMYTNLPRESHHIVDIDDPGVADEYSFGTPGASGELTM